MTTQLLIPPKFQAFDANGDPLSGGKLYTYSAGTTTPLATYTTYQGNVANANPVVLNSRGEANVWLTLSTLYYLELYTAAGVLIWSVDNVGGDNQLFGTESWCGTATGTANALVLTPEPAISEYVAGMIFTFKASASSNTTAATAAVSGLSAKAIQNDGAALVGGEIVANQYYLVIYDGTAFQLTRLSVTGIPASTTVAGVIEIATLAEAITGTDTSRAVTAQGVCGNKQYQTGVAYTTGGTSTAYTLTPAPALTALAENQQFDVEFHTAAGSTPTLAISGLTAKSLKYAAAGGTLTAVTSTQVPSGWRSRVTYDGTDMIVRDIPPTSGKLVQIVTYETGAVATGTTTIPYDDTIPQNTEGTEFMTLAITPTNASNTLEIDFEMQCSVNAAVAVVAAGLFQDSTANALSAILNEQFAGGQNSLLILKYIMTAGTTSATTFKVRAGPISAGTMTFNGVAGGRLFGGVMASRITIKEYLP